MQKTFFSWHWRAMQILRKNWHVVSNMSCGFKCDFSSNHSKVQKFLFNGLFLSKVYEVWPKKIQRSYLSLKWTVMQNLNKPWPCSFKNDITNCVNFHYSTQRSEKLFIDGLFLSKAYNVSVKKFQRVYVSRHWELMQNLKKNGVVTSKMT